MCYDVFSYNLPLVTWPTTYNAGRYALACYRRMNLDDLITKSREEYAVLAARLGSDPDFRTHIVNRIANRSDVLFDDVSVVQSHEQFLESSIREARLGILEG